MLRAEGDGEVTFLRLARTIAGRPLYLGGAYLAGGVLVDCGPPATAAAVCDWLQGRAVEAAVITHHHEDHSGGAALLKERRGLTPLIHRAGLERLAHGFPMEIYRRVAWGRHSTVEAAPLPEVVEAKGVRLEVVETPGHSPDHVCFFERARGWLFTGDLFLAERQRYLRMDEDFETLLASLRRVCALPVARVYCAHRGPVADGPAALRRRLDRLSSLRERVLDLLGQGLPEAEVARRAVGPEGPMTWLTFGHFSARNFVRSLARHPG
jgi:glyoxylase-like metal-dependent hydrolase (beta-lactamase superfamily II)